MVPWRFFGQSYIIKEKHVKKLLIFKHRAFILKYANTKILILNSDVAIFFYCLLLCYTALIGLSGRLITMKMITAAVFI